MIPLCTRWPEPTFSLMHTTGYPWANFDESYYFLNLDYPLK